MTVVDRITDIAERAIRFRFRMPQTEFDTFFADARREIEWTIDEFTNELAEDEGDK
jgi:hypothetical protein